MSRTDDRDAALGAMMFALESVPELVPAEGRVAFLHARPDQRLEVLGDRLLCEQNFEPVAAALAAAGFANAETLDGKFALVLLLPERQKEQALSDIARGFELLEDGGVLLVSLHNDWGARRFERLLADVAGEVGSLSKSHCRVFWARKSDNLDLERLAEWRDAAKLRRIEGGRFWSQPGFFSWDRADTGSKLLCAQLPRTLSGRAADLGAGWGYLSEHILRECPEVRVLDLFEADRRALEAARRTLTPMIGARRVNFRLADVTAGVGAALYNFVVMNPPFHEGRASDPFLGLRFIGAAAAALRPEGELWMVANRNLPYEAPLEELFETVEKLTEEQGFKIFRAAGTKVHRPSSRQRRQP